MRVLQLTQMEIISFKNWQMSRKTTRHGMTVVRFFVGVTSSSDATQKMFSLYFSRTLLNSKNCGSVPSNFPHHSQDWGIIATARPIQGSALPCQLLPGSPPWSLPGQVLPGRVAMSPWALPQGPMSQWADESMGPWALPHESMGR